MSTTVYLIPSVLDEESIETVPPYVMEAVRDCKVFFVENERTARRFLKKLSKELVIDDYEWIVMAKHANEEQDMISQFNAVERRQEYWYY
jgi:16S rRNA (cytidine1402-2'-O)-methyltransferase